jgi:hypothetical protein
MNDIQKLGAFTACAEAGISPDFIPQLEGAFPKLASAEAEPIGRLLLQGASEVMRLSQYGSTAQALHLKLAAASPVWTEHSQDLADHVSEVLRVLEPLEKGASFLRPGVEEIGDLAGTGARALGYGAVGAGAGLGALLWALKRHSQEEQTDQESLKKQIGYYHNLSKEMHDSMRRKYDYTGNDDMGDQNDQSEGVRTVAS